MVSAILLGFLGGAIYATTKWIINGLHKPKDRSPEEVQAAHDQLKAAMQEKVERERIAKPVQKANRQEQNWTR